MNNIVNKATEHGPYTYTYDGLYRLAGAASPVLPQENYTYDPVGNRLTSTAATNWTYNANNELQSYNGVTFQYDQNGNTTQRNDNGTVQNFLYDEDDRLTEVKDGNGAVVATYYYDPFGRRLWKEVGGTRTHSMYADEGLIAEFDGTGSETKSYGYAPNSTWTTNPLFMKEGTQYYFYHNDHLGTPQKMTSVNGSTVWSAKFESFGRAIIDPISLIQNNLRFPGQYYDQETGLHYNYHRYYDSGSSQYTSQDPIGMPGGNDLFRYVSDNPVNGTDAFGLYDQRFLMDSRVPKNFHSLQPRVQIAMYQAWLKERQPKQMTDIFRTTDFTRGGYSHGVNCLVKVGSLNAGALLTGEYGTGVIDCRSKCGERKCYSFQYGCGGVGGNVPGLPTITGVASAEVGVWSGEDINAFYGFSLQLSGAVAVGTKGASGAISLSTRGQGCIAGPAGGLAAGGSIMLCWTYDLKDVPCFGPNPLPGPPED
jgi:RHS repeat-associated protein